MSYKTHTTITLPADLKRRAKEKNINMSELFEQALARALDTGSEIERLKEKKKILLRKVEVITKEIEDCEHLMALKKEEAKKQEQKALRKEAKKLQINSEKEEKAIQTLVERVKMLKRLDIDAVIVQSEFTKLNPEELEEKVRERCEELGVEMVT